MENKPKEENAKKEDAKLKNDSFVQVIISKISISISTYIYRDFIQELLYAVIFQLIPIWIMFIFSLVLWDIKFTASQYTQNLIIFTITTSATTLGRMTNNKKEDLMSAMRPFVIFFLIAVICISCILYGILLLSSFEAMNLAKYVKIDIIKTAAICLALGSAIVGLCVAYSEGK